MWRLLLLANLTIDKPSAGEMVHGNLCLCPTYLLPKETVRIIKQELDNNRSVSLVLLDRITEKRYEGQILRILSAVDKKGKQRWNIRGKDIHEVPFKNDKSISYTGVSFRPVN